MAEEFGPFELERLLGRGGMAEVFIARRRDDAKREPLVLKRIRPELVAGGEEYLKRFVLEAQVASMFSHPNLVRFYEFGQVGVCRYIAMEEVRGFSLHRLLECVFESETPPPPEVALHIAAGVLDGLAAMHGVRDDQGRPRPMLHRDITPKNVIVTLDGRPVIIDFGIAKDMMGPSLTLPGKVIGTARYMSPEHRRAEYIDARADVFSIGVIMYELITGRHPWKPLETVKELLRVTFDPPELPAAIEASLPRDVREVVMRSVACDPADRFESAQDMSRALAACESFAALGERSAQMTRDWMRSLGIPSDQELDNPVLDYGRPKSDSGEDFVWSSHGVLSTGEEAFAKIAPAEPASFKVLTIPPLPPPRHEALDTGDVSIDFSPLRSRPMWVIALVLVAFLALVGVGSVILFRGHL